MARALILLFVLLLTPGCASYWGEGWDLESTLAESTFSAAVLYDVQVQSPEYVREGTELNFVTRSFGEDNLWAYSALSIGVHTYAMGWLSPEWRKRLQYFSIGAEGICVFRNWEINR